MLKERNYLLPLASDSFDVAEIGFPTVDSSGCVRVRTNAYSVGAKVGKTVQAKIYSDVSRTVARQQMRRPPRA